MTLDMRDPLDLIDRAFIGRCALSHPTIADEPLAPALPPPPFDLPPVDLPLARLLDAVPDQWLQVAEQIEGALAAGCRVFAFTAGRSGEGCTTVARGVCHALRGRGHRVVCVSRPPLQGRDPQACDRDVDLADIVIVDAGVWFPPGPIRRRSVAQQAIGCDAALLVRRADRTPCAAHGETLTAIGLRVVGEVITFTTLDTEELVEQPHG